MNPSGSIVPRPALLGLLAHDLRWRLVTLLVHSDRKVQELVDAVGQPINLVSYHLRQLRAGDLVVEKRSAADRRDRYYHLDLDRLRALYMETGAALHPALSPRERPARTGADDATAAKVRVLFLCTHNSARSQMAECLLRHFGGDHVEVFSAGTEPSEVHPLAIETMAARGIDLNARHGKSLSEFVSQPFDYVITVCDRARELCPSFPGDTEQIHWSFTDPAEARGPGAGERAFEEVASQLTTRINYLMIMIERQRRGRL